MEKMTVKVSPNIVRKAIRSLGSCNQLAEKKSLLKQKHKDVKLAFAKNTSIGWKHIEERLNKSTFEIGKKS